MLFHTKTTVCLKYFGHDCRFDIPTAKIEDMNKIIKNINPKKATGPDKIPPKIVGLSAKLINSHLINIKNNDLGNNYFSTEAKVAIVRPMYKNKNRKKIENYRPVGILSCFSKVYEKFLFEKFKPFINAFCQNSLQTIGKITVVVMYL